MAKKKKTTSKKTKVTKEEKQYLKNLQKETLQTGRNLEKQGRYAEAIKKYTSVMTMSLEKAVPLDHYFYFRRGYSNYQLGNYESALKDYTIYMEKVPTDHVVYNNAGLCYCIGKKNHKKEFELFKKGIALNPKYSLIRRNMAVCLKERGKYKDALKEAGKAIEIDPNNSYNHSAKGDILELMGKKEEALQSYQNALDLDPNNAPANKRLNGIKKTDKQLSDFVVEIPKRTFDDVAGLTKLKRWARNNVLAPRLNPDLAKKYGRRFGGGVLMYGPPGCGKTYFVSALAGEGKVNLMKVKLSSMLNMWLGNSEKNIAKLFQTARRKKPCIIFVDEIDGLGGKRAGMEGHHNTFDKIVNEFLMQVGEIEEKKQEVLVIGATNMPWAVDDALKRSGRFGTHIYVPEPDEDGKLALFKMYLKDLPTAKDINVKKLAKMGKHLSAADIKAICERAAGTAFEQAMESKNLVEVNQEMLEQAVKEERSDVLEWYNSATKRTNMMEMKEFYPDLYNDIMKVVKKEGKSIGESGMFR